MGKFKVLIVPSSDEEGYFDESDTFTDAVKILSKGEYGSASIHEFQTRQQMDAFIAGYQAGIGYLGDGVYFKNC